MITALLWLSLSLVVLFFGADWLVKGSSSLAMRLGITPLVVGLTVVALGTSTPELLVSIKAAIQGAPEIAVGNVVGSNIFNIGIILGISALIYPIAVNSQLLRLDLPVLLATVALFTALFWDGNFGRIEGGLFILALIVYTLYIVRLSRRSKTVASGSDEGVEVEIKVLKYWWQDLLYFVVGLAGLMFGSDLLVDNAVILAHHFGLSEAVIGLTIIAAGTGMPELATSVVAAMRRNNDIAVGNVIGSGIYNLLAVMGISAVVSPIRIEAISSVDNIVMALFVLLLLPFMRSGSILSRREGVVLILLYLCYMGYLLY